MSDESPARLCYHSRSRAAFVLQFFSAKTQTTSGDTDSAIEAELAAQYDHAAAACLTFPAMSQTLMTTTGFATC